MSHEIESGPAGGAPVHVETEVWEPLPDGHCRLVRVKTVTEVFAEIRAVVGDRPEGAEEYLSVPIWIERDQEWPSGRIVVFAVTGASEGHYLHVEVLSPGGHQCVILGKTFQGKDAAWTLARRLADLLWV